MRVLPLLLLAFLLTGCWPSVSEDILDSFISINDSLAAGRVRSAQRGPAGRTELPAVPYAELGCPEFQQSADSLGLALEFAAHASGPFFSDLHGVPQDDAEAGDRSFTTKGQGEELFTAITRVYDIASSIVPDDSVRARIQEVRMSSFPHRSHEDWRAASFTGVPRAAVVAMLSKLARDQDELRGVCDNALLKACAEKK